MSKRKLLLADDSITIQKVVNLTFADEGIEVIAVGDGDSAMRKFDEFIPDLVMADVNMPGLTGYEVCQIIKQNEVTQHIPVILLVGSFEPFDEEAAKNAGADDYLTKPFQSIRQLVNKVTDLLNNGSAPAVEAAPEAEPSAELAAVPDLDEPIPYQEPIGDASAPVEAYDELDPYVEPVAAVEEVKAYEPEIAPIADYGDSGFDDEMIETSPASSYGAEPVADYQAETSIDYAKTQPLNAADLKGFSLVGDRDDDAPAAPEDSAESDSYEIDADAEAGLYDYDTTPAAQETTAEVADEVSETVADEVAAPLELERVTDDPEPESDDAPLEVPEASAPEEVAAESEPETVEAVEEADDDIAVLEDEPAAEAVETEVATETVTEAEVAETTQVVETEEVEVVAETPATEEAPEIDFDDGDLLELPPLVEETGIRPADSGLVVEAPIERAVETPAEPTVEPATTPDVMQSFPPELIEAIAKKVAEQISAKTMADVLPQITELVMKKMAEEKND